MIGLEYILNLYNMPHNELAEKLGIRKQNINLWIKGKQSISKKHLPKLSEIFGIGEEFFQKELDAVDQLIIQKNKLQMELKPTIIGYDQQLMIGENSDIVEKPIYNTEVINEIEFEIEKAKLVEEFREILSPIDKDYELQLIQQIIMLLQEHRKENIFTYVIDAVSHYYDVLPDWVGDPDSDDFVEEFIELVQKYDDKEE